ncbi:uncharacterized protein LOC104265931 [Ciona intestinalis]
MQQLTTTAQTTAGLVEETTAARTTAGVVEETTAAQTTAVLVEETTAAQTTAVVVEETTTAQTTAGLVKETTTAQTTAGLVEETTTAQTTAGLVEETTATQTTAGLVEETTTAQTTAGLVEETTAAQTTTGLFEETTAAQTTAGLVEETTAAQTTASLVEQETTTSQTTAETTTAQTNAGLVEEETTSGLVEETTATQTTTGLVEETTTAHTTASLVEEETTTSQTTAGLVEETTTAQTTASLVEETTTAQTTASLVEETTPAQTTASLVEETTAAQTTAVLVEETTAAQTTAGLVEETTTAHTTAGLVEETTTAQTTAGLVEETTAAQTTAGLVEETTAAQTTAGLVEETTAAQTTSGLVEETTTAQTTAGLGEETTTAHTTAGLVEETTTTQTTAGSVKETTTAQTTAGLVKETTAAQTTAGVVEKTTAAQTTAGLVEETTAAQTTVGLVEETTTAQTSAGVVEETTAAQTTAGLVEETTTAQTSAGVVEETTTAKSIVNTEVIDTLSTTVVHSVGTTYNPSDPVVEFVTSGSDFVSVFAVFKVVSPADSYIAEIFPPHNVPNSKQVILNSSIQKVHNVTFFGLLPATTYNVTITPIRNNHTQASITAYIKTGLQLINIFPNNRLFSTNFLLLEKVGHPSNVFVTNITKTSFVLNWDLILKADYYVLQILVPSRVVRRDVDASSGFYVREFNITSSSALVSGLEPGTIYTIRLLAVFDGFRAEYVEILQATKPNPVKFLNVTHEGFQSITVEFGAADGNLQYYSFTIAPLYNEDNILNTIKVNKTDVTNTGKVEFVNLTPETLYSITARTHVLQESSDPVVYHQAKTVSVSVVDFGTTTTSAYFVLHPWSQNLVDAYEFVVYPVKDSSIPRANITFHNISNSTAHNVTLENMLDPDTSYIVIITPQLNNVALHSLTVNITTAMSYPVTTTVQMEVQTIKGKDSNDSGLIDGSKPDFDVPWILQVMIDNVTETTAIVSWQPLSGATIYQVTYSDPAGLSAGLSVTTISTSHFLSNLEHNTLYTVVVRPRNLTTNWGTPSNFVNFTTGESASVKIISTWTNPVSAYVVFEPLDPHILTYFVSISPVSNLTHIVATLVTNSHASHNTSVFNATFIGFLVPFTDYRFNITPNLTGSSPTYAYDITEKFGKPTNLTAQRVWLGGFDLTWKPVLHAQSYVVQVFESKESVLRTNTNNSRLVLVKQITDLPSAFAAVSDLYPATKYVVWVHAHVNGLDSNYTDLQISTGNLPNATLTVTNALPETLNIEYNTVNDGVSYYVFSIASKSNETVKLNVQRIGASDVDPSVELAFTNLVPGSEYICTTTIHIGSISVAGVSVTANTTLQPPPSSSSTVVQGANASVVVQLQPATYTPQLYMSSISLANNPNAIGIKYIASSVPLQNITFINLIYGEVYSVTAASWIKGVHGPAVLVGNVTLSPGQVSNVDVSFRQSKSYLEFNAAPGKVDHYLASCFTKSNPNISIWNTTIISTSSNPSVLERYSVKQLALPYNTTYVCRIVAVSNGLQGDPVEHIFAVGDALPRLPVILSFGNQSIVIKLERFIYYHFLYNIWLYRGPTYTIAEQQITADSSTQNQTIVIGNVAFGAQYRVVSAFTINGTRGEQFIVGDLIMPPDNVQIIEVVPSYTHAEVKFEQADGEIDTYEIHLTSLKNGRVIKSYNITHNINVNTTSQTLLNLSPGQQYNVTLVARSNGLISIENTVSFMTAVIPAPEINQTTVVVGRTNISISGSTLNEPLTKDFIFNLRILLPTNPTEPVNSVNVENSTSNLDVLFENLIPGQQYDLEIVTLYKNWTSAPVPIGTYVVPPSPIESWNSSSTAVTIRIRCTPPLGIVDQYIIWFNRSDEQNTTNIIESELPNYEFTDLTPETDYQFTVWTNSHGVESTRNNFFIKTTPIPEPRFVTALPSSDQLSVTIWPDLTQHLQYNVTLFSSNNSKPVDHVVLNTKESLEETILAVFRNLTPGERYTGRVSATINGVDGKPYPFGPITISPATVTGRVLHTLSSVNITFFAAKGYAESYRIYIVPTADVTSVEKIDIIPASAGKTEYKYSFVGLEANTNYSVIVVTQHNGLNSNPAIFRTATVDPLPLLPPIGNVSVDESNTIHVRLQPVTTVPVTSYVISISYNFSPNQTVAMKEVSQSDSPQTQFIRLIDGQTYIVSAKSKYENLQSVTNIIGSVTLRPGKINPVIVMTATTGDISFTPPDGIADRFTLSVHKQGEEHETVDNATLHYTLRQIQTLLHHVFRNLIPDTVYVGEAKSYSKHRTSYPTTFNMTTEKPIPAGGSITLFANRSVEVIVTLPDNRDAAGWIGHYHVFVKPASNTSISLNATLPGQNPPTSIFNNLTYGEHYFVYISNTVSGVESLLNKIEEFVVDPAKISNATLNPTSNQVNVTFEPAEGVTDRYFIYITKDDEPTSVLVFKYVASSNQSGEYFLALDNLDPSTNYTLSVVSLSYNKNSPTASFTFRTNDVSVGAGKITVTKNNTIVVNMKPVNGFERIFVNLALSNDSSNILLTNVILANSSNLETEFSKGLVPGAKYIVTYIVSTSTEQSPPGELGTAVIRPSSVVGGNISSSVGSITLHFPPAQNISDSYRAYVVKLSHPMLIQEEMIIPKNKINVNRTFTAQFAVPLSANTSYIVYLFSRSNGKESLPTTYITTTDSLNDPGQGNVTVIGPTDIAIDFSTNFNLHDIVQLDLVISSKRRPQEVIQMHEWLVNTSQALNHTFHNLTPGESYTVYVVPHHGISLVGKPKYIGEVNLEPSTVRYGTVEIGSDNATLRFTEALGRSEYFEILLTPAENITIVLERFNRTTYSDYEDHESMTVLTSNMLIPSYNYTFIITTVAESGLRGEAAYAYFQIPPPPPVTFSEITSSNNTVYVKVNRVEEMHIDHYVVTINGSSHYLRSNSTNITFTFTNLTRGGTYEFQAQSETTKVFGHPTITYFTLEPEAVPLQTIRGNLWNVSLTFTKPTGILDAYRITLFSGEPTQSIVDQQTIPDTSENTYSVALVNASPSTNYNISISAISNKVIGPPSQATVRTRDIPVPVGNISTTNSSLTIQLTLPDLPVDNVTMALERLDRPFGVVEEINKPWSTSFYHIFTDLPPGHHYRVQTNYIVREISGKVATFNDTTVPASVVSAELNITSSSVSVLFNPISFADSYVVTITSDNEPDLVLGQRNLTQTVDGSDLLATFDREVQTGVSYTVHITTVKRNKRSETSAFPVGIVPAPNITNLSVKTNQNGSTIITVETPPIYDGQYVVTIYPSLHKNTTVQTYSSPANVSVYHLPPGSLVPGTEYNLEAKTLSNGTEGPPRTIKFCTYPNVANITDITVDDTFLSSVTFHPGQGSSLSYIAHLMNNISNRIENVTIPADGRNIYTIAFTTRLRPLNNYSVVVESYGPCGLMASTNNEFSAGRPRPPGAIRTTPFQGSLLIVLFEQSPSPVDQYTVLAVPQTTNITISDTIIAPQIQTFLGGFVPGETYEIRVTATMDGVSSLPSISNLPSQFAPNPVPAGSVKSTPTEATVTFTPPSGVFDSFDSFISIVTPSGPQFVQQYVVQKNETTPSGQYQTTFNHSSLKPNTSYIIWVTTQVGDLKSPTTRFPTVLPLPTPPQSLRVSSSINNTLNIELGPSRVPVDNYLLRIFHDSDLSKLVSNITLPPSTNNIQTKFENLTPCGRYRVYASSVIRNVSGNSIEQIGSVGELQ